MSAETSTVPAYKSNLIIRPFGRDGEYVVKNPVLGTYHKMGEQEHFLLLQLDGRRSEADVLQAFYDRFRDPISTDDLQGFVKMASQRDLLSDGRTASSDEVADDEDDEDLLPDSGPKQRQSWLFFRYNFFDPNRLFNRLEPKLRFIWTRGFFIVSLLLITAASMVAWSNQKELVSTFGKHLNWETAVLIWVVTIFVTTCHEFAHGLTCKRYGGDVHEVGLLVMFFTPCFYCNVSDAWLIPEKSKRLWITAAGGYCDLCLWAGAMFIWRFTQQDTLINYIAYIVLSVCGVRGLVNLNPLMRLDGYYLLCDWLEIPNLRRRSREYWMSFVRWALWGASFPKATQNGRVLVVYGAMKWLFYVVFLDVMYISLCRWLGERWGVVGLLAATYLASIIVRRIFKGFFGGEFVTMLKTRPVRTTAWAAALFVGALVLCLVRIDNRASGSFAVRPATHLEVRAPVAGFLRAVHYDMGQTLRAGTVIGCLEIPDLESLVAQKQAQLRESEANLRQLTAGPRPEAVREQRLKVERAQAWYDLGMNDLTRARHAQTQDLNRLDQQIAQSRAEVNYSAAAYKQAEQLYRRGVMAGQQLMSERKRYDVSVMQLQQAEAQRRSQEVSGTLTAEAEAARRKKDLADEEAALKLLEAGSRPEEIEAEKARGARLQEELTQLLETRKQLEIRSPVSGMMTTARMKEKIGQYFEKGALICVIEDATGLEAELDLDEQEVQGVQAGQVVELKARAVPFRTFRGKVERIAPRAEVAQGAVQGKVTVYCKLDDRDLELLAGMTGVGRVFRGAEPIGSIVAKRAMRYVRTEFWW
jgi:putative peptide zinc metalloprotease protein